MRRRLLATVVVCAALAGCGRPPHDDSPGAVRIDSSWSNRAISSDLPSAQQIGRLFPAHVGGELDVGYLAPQRSGQESQCPGDFVITELGFVSGRWGSYVSPGDEEAYFRGEPGPTVFVHAFESPADAQAGLKAAAANLASCGGERREDGQQTTSHPLAGLPDGYLGHRTHQFTANSYVPSGQTEDFFTDVFAVKRNFLVETRIQDATAFPPARQVIALARLALGVAGEEPRPRARGTGGATFVDFRRNGAPHGGEELETPADAMQLKRVSPEFRSAMSQLLQGGDGKDAPCLPLRVQTYRSDGFARVMFAPCGLEEPGRFEVWAEAKGEWRPVADAAAPEEFDCRKLEAAKVPLGIAIDWCVTGKEGLGTDYPRR
jgi:hypothetical protein